MKKLVISILLVSLSFAGHTQITDSICLPIPQAKNVLKAAELGKIYKQELDSTKALLSVLNSRLSAQGQRITTLNKNISDYRSLVGSYKKDSANLTKQRDLAISDRITFQKEIRRQKKKTTLTVLAGVVSSFTILYFTTK